MCMLRTWTSEVCLEVGLHCGAGSRNFHSSTQMHFLPRFDRHDFGLIRLKHAF